MSTSSPEPENFAPQISTDIAVLALSVAAAKIDSEQVRDLLWLLNAPPDLSDLQPVLIILSDVLDRAEKEWPGILDYQGLDQLPELLKRLLAVLPNVTFSHGWSRDWVSRNALYCALRHTLSPTQPLLQEYSLLQAHFFFAHSAYLISHTSREGYESYGGSEEWPALKIDAYHAGLCIRDMAEKRHSDWAGELLQKLPVHLSPRDLPAESSVAMEIKKKNFSVQKKVNYVSDYLCQVYGVKQRGKGHGSSPRTPNWDMDSEIGDPDDPALDFGVLADWEVASNLVKAPVNPLILPTSKAAEAHQPVPSEPPEEEEEDQKAGSDECPHEDESDRFLGGYECQWPAR